MEERAFWLAWSQMSGIGPILLMRLKQHFGSLAVAWEAKANELAAMDGLGPQTAQAIARGRSQLNPEALLRQHEKANPHFWTPADPAYPRLLLEIPDPPPLLYYRGDVDLNENRGLIPAIAIVGTRDPSDYGRRWTRKLSAVLAQNGFTVVSGLAEGIDTEAHRSCLGAGGRTLAVLGTGVDVVYPSSNRGLAQQIPKQGLLLSEYPNGTKPDRGNFPRRNRIIAGLSRAILVLEAPRPSGALITARLANDYNRDVYALPGSLDNARAIGCLKLISDGAHLILSEQHLLDMLATIPRLMPDGAGPQEGDQLSLLDAAPPSPPLPPLDPELEKVLQAVSSEPSSLDTLVLQLGLNTGAVLSALVQLELMGLVSQLPGMRYQRQ